MEPQYVYHKKRSEFGRQCQFSDKGPDLIENVMPNKKLRKNFILRWDNEMLWINAESFIMQ